MAEAKATYPMVTEQRWWTLRERFRQSLPSRVTSAYLHSVLGISERTASDVELPNLRRLSLVDRESGAPTDVAKMWRDDQQYADACAKMRDAIYPEELQSAAPDPTADEPAATRWFMNQGVGEAAAKQMARTYRLIGQPSIKDPSERSARRKTATDGSAPRRASASLPKARAARAADVPTKLPAHELPKRTAAEQDVRERRDDDTGKPRGQQPSLHIDIQIHISADAKAEQIDQMFASMAKHLYGRDE